MAMCTPLLNPQGKAGKQTALPVLLRQWAASKLLTPLKYEDMWVSVKLTIASVGVCVCVFVLLWLVLLKGPRWVCRQAALPFGFDMWASSQPALGHCAAPFLSSASILLSKPASLWICTDCILFLSTPYCPLVNIASITFLSSCFNFSSSEKQSSSS